MAKITNPAFEKAAEEQQRMKKEEEANKGGDFSGVEYTEIEYMGMENQVEKAFRIIGNTIEIRENEFDPKLILMSEIVKDDLSGYIRVNWPVVDNNGKFQPDSSWILTRLYDKVMDGEWIKLAEKNKFGKDCERKHFNVGTDVYQRVSVNSKNNDKGFPKNFYPKKRVLMNVIDRHDAWCAENNHTKILSSGVGSKDYPQDDGTTKTIKFPQIGIPHMLYSKMFEHFMRFRGDWDVDAVVTKQSERKEYDIYDATDEKYLTDAIKPYIKEDDLTEAEAKYERYDINKLYNVTTYRKLLKNLSGLFKLCDTTLKTNFYDELLSLAEEEKKQSEIDNPKEDATPLALAPAVEKSDPDKAPFDGGTKIEEEPKEEVKEETKTEAPPKRRRKTEETTSVDSAYETHFASWGELNEEEQEIMKESIANLTPDKVTYKDGVTVEGCWEDSCDATFPSNVAVCPVCGAN